MPIEKLFDVTGWDDANLAILKEILDKLHRESVNIKYTTTVPTASTLQPGEMAIYESGGTTAVYWRSAAGTVFSTSVDTDVKAAIDSGATAGYIGAAATDGILRFTLADGFTYSDGGDYVTIGLDINYADVSGNDGATDVTAAELEELSDGSETTLHSHAASNTDFSAYESSLGHASGTNYGPVTEDGFLVWRADDSGSNVNLTVDVENDSTPDQAVYGTTTASGANMGMPGCVPIPSGWYYKFTYSDMTMVSSWWVPIE